MSLGYEAHEMNCGEQVAANELVAIENPREYGGFLYNQPTQLYSNVVSVRGEPIKWTLEVPEHSLAYDGVAHFISGYGGIKQTSRAQRHALAKRGMTTLSSEPARGGRLLKVADMRDIQRLHTEAQVAIAEDLREQMPEVVRSTPNASGVDIDKKVLLPHSMGGAPAVGYAEEELAAVDMIINLATIGRGAPKIADILTITPSDIVGSVRHELLPAVLNGDIEPSMANLGKIIRYYARLRAAFEALSCVRLDFREQHARLRDRGVAVRSIDFEHDILVPISPEHADTMLRDTGHMAPQCKADRVAQQILFLEQHRDAPVAKLAA